MSALRRLWQPSEYRLQHAEWMAIIETWGNEWRCELYRNGEWYSFHDARSFVGAQEWAERMILQEVAGITREQVILESARVDCREVRS